MRSISQFVWLVFGWQYTFFAKYRNNLPYKVYIQTSFLTSLQVFFEAVGEVNGIHYPRICDIISSTLSAW